MRFKAMVLGVLLAVPAACTDGNLAAKSNDISTEVPVMRWDHRPEAALWTEATLAALKAEGAVLATTIPADIGTYCPAYPQADVTERRAFWSGMLSALAKHESTWNPKAAGGGGKWLGLMQIAPGTARAYGCDTGKGLYDGSTNLVCAVRIAASQVGRDGAIVTDGSGGWRGLARDWAPMRIASKRAEMASWTSKQSYCTDKG